ncbi:MAG TPA: hypothetical protein VMG40_09635 [Bryobacteraceae bacterium]|nr:hypothetical protein [Bryobacteraceae bacterium]
MTPLVHQRCAHHPSREAVARCAACRGYFCRECVTEHEGRMICASCAASRGTESQQPRSAAGWVAAGAAGFLLAWLAFYYLGLALARIPADFFGAV